MEICARTNADAVGTDWCAWWGHFSSGAGGPVRAGFPALYLWGYFQVVITAWSHSRAAGLPLMPVAMQDFSLGLLLAPCSSTKSHACWKPRSTEWCWLQSMFSYMSYQTNIIFPPECSGLLAAANYSSSVAYSAVNRLSNSAEPVFMIPDVSVAAMCAFAAGDSAWWLGYWLMV